MDTIEKQSLAVRTRQRNALTWLPLDYGGLMAPLASMETELDLLAKASIENFMAISDESWGIKEEQRDKTIELSQIEIDQDRILAEAKVATGQAKIAIERAVDEYVLAAKIYDTRVKGLIMAAKEFAALVEREQLANEEARTGLAIDKEALRLIKVETDIYLETLQQAMVEADIAKAQVEVAKAHVRAAIAGIEAGKAEIELIEAEIQKYMAEVEKATLQADVAMIYAEILTKQLSEIKLGVGIAEIAAGYTYIQSKLDDALALYDAKKLIEEIRTEAEEAMKEELARFLAVEEAEQALQLLEQQYARILFDYEKEVTPYNLAEEERIRQALVEARKDLSAARMQLTIAREGAQTTAAGMVSAAQKLAHALSSHTSQTWEERIEYISG